MTTTPTARHEKEARRLAEIAPLRSRRQQIASALAEARAAGRAEERERCTQIVRDRILVTTSPYTSGGSYGTQREALREVLDEIRSLAAAPQTESNFPEPQKGCDQCDPKQPGSVWDGEWWAPCPSCREIKQRARERASVDYKRGLQEAARMAREREIILRDHTPSEERRRMVAWAREEELASLADDLTALAASGAGEIEQGDVAQTARGQAEQPASGRDAGSSPAVPSSTAAEHVAIKPDWIVPLGSAGPEVNAAIQATAAEREARRERAREMDAESESGTIDLLVRFAEAELARERKT